MARIPQDITDAELAVLRILWQRGPCTIRQITDVLYPEGRTAHYATVQKLLERLENKNWVARDRTPTIHVFAARLDRDELIGRRLRAVADKLCGGSWTPLVSHLVQQRRLSADDRRRLRELIDQFDSSDKDKTRRGK
jgi:predicted transcriptional regulator